jgi:periplasmic divalent cation tolerance protein
MRDTIVVLVTCESIREARKIGRALLEQRLVACANILEAPVHSIYRWKGRVRSAKEILVVFKTIRKRFAAVEREVRRLHSYDVPEIIALPIVTGSAQYLRWMYESVGGAK